MKILQTTFVSLCAVTLVACGTGAQIADNREAAAAAAFSASRGANSANSMMRAAMVQAATSASASFDCPHGGSAAYQVSGAGVDLEGNVTFDIAYANCNWDGATSMNGTVHFAMGVEVDQSGTSFSMALGMSGRVNFSGEISDFVEMDITETISASGLTSTSGTVSVVLNGTITTSSNTYTYNHETITVTADGIPAAEG